MQQLIDFFCLNCGFSKIKGHYAGNDKAKKDQAPESVAIAC
jgi:hypothetical protein